MVGCGRLKGPKPRLMSTDIQGSWRIWYQVQGSGQAKWVECLWPMGAEEEEKRAGVKSTYRLGAARQNWCWMGSTGLKSLTGCGAGGKIKSRCYMWVQWQRRTHLRQGQDVLDLQDEVKRYLMSIDGQHWKLVTKQADLSGSGGWVTYLDWGLKHLKERVWHVWPEEEHMGILKGFCVGRVAPAIVCLYACFVFNRFWCLSLFGQNVAWPLSTNILAFVIIGDTFCLYNSHMNNLAFAFWIFFLSVFILHFYPICPFSATTGKQRN